MLTYVVAFLIALAVAAVLTPLVTAIAHRLHLFDIPDQIRKVHVRAVPRLGGIAVVLAFLCAIAGLYALPFGRGAVSAALFADSTMAYAFAVGALAIVALGVYDDLRGASAKLKFAVQISVAVAMWGAGFRVEHIGGSVGVSIDLGLLSLPITVIWIVGVVNAVNLIDGLDGLASGIALTAALVLFGVAIVNGEVLLAVIMAALAGSLVGFLFFNFNPARIFLGDSGSLFLGFVLAVTSIWTQQKAPTAAAITLLPLFALAVPLLDTTLCIVRRVSRGQSPFSPDREHLHHRLMTLGLSHKGAVLTLYAVAALFALVGLEMLDTDPTRRTIAIGAAFVLGALLIRRVGLFGAWPPAGHEVLTRAHNAATVIRRSANLDTAWREVAGVLPAIGCEEARLTVSAGKYPRRELSWCIDDREDSGELVVPSKDHALVRLAFGKRAGTRGELVLILDDAEETPPMRAAYRRALKSLHQALNDVAAAQEQVPARLPWISDRRATQRALLD